MQIDFPIDTEEDCIGEIKDREGFNTLAYEGGGFSRIPFNFFTNWRNHCPTPGKFYIGRCSALGANSSIRYTLPTQSVRIGRYVSAGIETIFMCSGFHETRTISTCEFGSYDKDMLNVYQREYGEIVVKNDVWLGDSCLIMAGAKIENGCVIGARSVLPTNFKSEPYGIYVGSPARLKKFRFSEKVRETLLDIAWWDMPFSWVKEHNNYFLVDMTLDGSFELLDELKEKKWMNAQNTCVA